MGDQNGSRDHPRVAAREGDRAGASLPVDDRAHGGAPDAIPAGPDGGVSWPPYQAASASLACSTWIVT